MGPWITTLSARSLTGYARKKMSAEEIAEIESIDEEAAVKHLWETIADRRRAEGIDNPFRNRVPMLVWMNPTRN